MPTASNLLCGCGRFLEAKRNSVTVEELLEDGRPYKLWDADLWACPECGIEIIAGFGRRPIVEHWEPTYPMARARLAPIYPGRCREISPMADLFIYTTPAAATVTLTLDSGVVLEGESCVANGRDDAHRLAVPDGTPTQGGLLRVTCDGKTPFEGRGIVQTLTPPCFLFDNVHLADAPIVPDPPPVYPTGTPEQIIIAVYDQGDHDLATKQGCGEFVEDCCDALHASDPMWGHIKKTGAQNQWNGHAVDALMLATGEACGIYDIIHDSESPNATPAYIYKGAPDLSLWYYNEPS